MTAGRPVAAATRPVVGLPGGRQPGARHEEDRDREKERRDAGAERPSESVAADEDGDERR